MQECRKIHKEEPLVRSLKTKWEEIECGTLTLMRNAGNASLDYEEMSCAKMKAMKTLCGKKNNRKVIGAWSDCQKCSVFPSITVRKVCSSLAYPKLPQAGKERHSFGPNFQKNPREHKK